MESGKWKVENGKWKVCQGLSFAWNIVASVAVSKE
jgi:hypothetical protein